MYGAARWIGATNSVSQRDYQVGRFAERHEISSEGMNTARGACSNIRSSYMHGLNEVWPLSVIMRLTVDGLVNMVQTTLEWRLWRSWCDTVSHLGAFWGKFAQIGAG